MLSIYVVSSWVLLQVLAVTWEALGLPRRSITYLIILLLGCFPVFIFLVWKFRVAPQGKNIELLEGQEGTGSKSFHKIYFSALGIITTICVITIFLIVGNTFSKSSVKATVLQSNKIAVFKFGNNTGDPKYDIVSKMAADWVIHGITENNLGQVISQEVISQYSDIFFDGKSAMDESTMVREYLKPARIISGNFYLNKDQLIFQSSISEEATGKTLISFKKIICSADSSLDCIEDLSESITGYLATSANKKLMLQDSPPKYDAYKYLLEAKNTDDNEEHLILLNKSILADTTYFEPKVFRVAYYYNQQDYKTADSLLRLIDPDSRQNLRQLNLLNMYAATLKGDNRKAYESLLKEYNIAPFDLVTNKTAMVLALQFVNRPQDVGKIYKAIRNDSLDFQNCNHCVERQYVKALADIQLKNYDEAIKMSRNVLKEVDSDLMKIPLISALVRSGNSTELNDFLFQSELSASPEALQELYILAGREYLLQNDKIAADLYLNKSRKLDSLSTKRDALAESLFYLQDYSKAEAEYKKLHKVNPQDIEFLGRLAICNFKLGNTSEADRNLKDLENLKGKYQFGEVDYFLAEYYAVAGNEEEMYHKLLKSIAEGRLFTSSKFQNDPIFRDYIDSERFKKALKFWY